MEPVKTFGSVSGFGWATMARSALAASALGLTLAAPAAAQGVRSLFNGDYDPTVRGNKTGVRIDVVPRFPRPQESTSGLTVITPPSMDRDGYISGGSSRSDYGQNRVGRGTLSYDSEGRAFWYSNYRNNFGSVQSPVRAYPKYDRTDEVRRQRERQAQEQRQRDEQIRRQRELDRQREQREREQEMRRQAMQQEAMRRQAEQQAIANGINNLANSIAENARAQQFRRQQEQEWARLQRQRQIEEAQMRRNIEPPASPDDAPAAPPQGRPAGTYARNLGLHYEAVPYQDGTFGVKVTAFPAEGTPAHRLGFEPGDVIFALDGQRFRSHDDVLAHRADTTVDFVNVRTNAVQNATVTLP